jgi:hypothetical protein
MPCGSWSWKACRCRRAVITHSLCGESSVNQSARMIHDGSSRTLAETRSSRNVSRISQTKKGTPSCARLASSAKRASRDTHDEERSSGSAIGIEAFTNTVGRMLPSGRAYRGDRWSNAAGLCRPAACVWSYGTSTISFFIGPKTLSNSPFSCAGTLKVSRASTRSPTKASKAAPVIFMPLCVVFMSFPV